MAEPGPWEQVLRELGQRHEAEHLATFPCVTDLSEGSEDERWERTGKALSRRDTVLYQPLLMVDHEVKDNSIRLVGSPDFLIPHNDGWHIRDVKLSRSLETHPEIVQQLDFYGLLLHQTLRTPPSRLDVLLGSGDIEEVTYSGRTHVERQIKSLLEIMKAGEIYEPVGWSKCSSCGYFDVCWPAANEGRNVATLPDVDQNLARTLHELGCETIGDLLDQFSDESLAALRRPRGQRMQRVGKSASKILLQARALSIGDPHFLSTPDLPAARNLVMFDVEGLPPHLDEVDKVFLWGLKVYGPAPSDYMAATAFPGESNDEATWLRFLDLAQGVFQEHGADVPFVHWAAYEKTKIRQYIERYGDRSGIGQQVMDNLVDLLRITTDAVVLPIPSNSLKVVEEYIGFERTIAGSGDWAMAQYILASETDDKAKARELLDQVLKYNEEDLEATWMVWCWLRNAP